MKHKGIVACVTLILAMASQTSLSQWHQMNGPCVDTVYALSSNSTALLAALTTGCYQTTDDGDSWSCVLPADSGVFAIVSSGGWFIAASRSSMIRSDDNGLTWQAANAGLEQATVLSLAANDTEIVAGTSTGAYLSTDRGAAWHPTGFSFRSPRVAISSPAFGTDSTMMAVVNYSDTVYVSTDNGIHWFSRKIQFPSPNPSMPLSPLFVGTELLIGNSYGYVFATQDLGATWSNVLLPGSEPHSVKTIDQLGQILFAGTAAGIYRSSDTGGSWLLLDSGTTSPANRNILCLAHRASALFAGTSGTGVKRSRDDGTTWKQVNSGLGLPNSSVAFLATTGQTMFAGTRDQGIFVSDESGGEWRPGEVIPGAVLITALAAKDSIVLSGMNPGAYRTTDQGKSWTPAGEGAPQDLITCIAFNDTGIFLGTVGSGVFGSSDFDTGWTDMSLSYPSSLRTPNTLVSSGKHLFVGTQDGVCVYDSVPRVRPVPLLYAWYPRNSGLTSTNIVALTSAGGNLLAAAQVNAFNSSPGVFLSSDEGESWMPAVAGLADSNVVAFAVRGSNVFAATWSPPGRFPLTYRNEGSVFLSTNRGLSWEPIGDGLPGIGILSLALGKSDIYAGTNGRGVWSRPLSEVTNVADHHGVVSETFFLFQNSPNPFNPSTAISYQLSTPGRVNLKVYDILGREVMTLVNEVKQPGKYVAQFDGSRLASGVYFYRLRGHDFAQVKKMLLLR